jgi:small-conductance mechanosensitive channel
LAIVTLSVVFAFDQFIAKPLGLPTLLSQTYRIMILIVFGLLIIFFIRRSNPLITKRFGVQIATIFQFFMVLAVVIVEVFSILDVFQVSGTTLLVSGGIVTVVIGLVISTFAGNILAGALVLVTHSFRVGDTVLVNGVPGKIVAITTMTTQIKNDLGGQINIPNTAIAQGTIILTKIQPQATVTEGRLPYSLGDRIYTTYMNTEGTVSELDTLRTKIKLDSGSELTFLNSTVIAGTVAIAKIMPVNDDELKFSLTIEGDAEKTIDKIKHAAGSNPSMFKSAPQVLYSSLKQKAVELEISCKVDPKKKSEAKNLLLKTAHLSNTEDNSPHSEK